MEFWGQAVVFGYNLIVDVHFIDKNVGCAYSHVSQKVMLFPLYSAISILHFCFRVKRDLLF